MIAGQSHGDFMAAILLPIPFDDSEARIIAARVLAEHIAAEQGRNYSDVWAVLIRVDDRLLSLLDSPAGWAALSSMVSATMGGAGNLLNPSIH